MQYIRTATWQRSWTLLAALLVLKVAGTVVLNCRDYFPPNFNAGFLQGREAYFYGSYQWAFYAHVVSGPLALVMGLVLMSERFRQRFATWHRRLGRMQAMNVLVLVSPSGLWMAARAEGFIAQLGFASLAIATGTCVALGWRSAVRRCFTEHGRWMTRCFLLLASAVVIRMIGGLATVTGTQDEWIDPLAAWASWLLPLLAYEAYLAANHAFGRSQAAATTPVGHSTRTSSPAAMDIIARS